jgi:hypothetical protein
MREIDVNTAAFVRKIVYSSTPWWALPAAESDALKAQLLELENLRQITVKSSDCHLNTQIRNKLIATGAEWTWHPATIEPKQRRRNQGSSKRTTTVDLVSLPGFTFSNYEAEREPTGRRIRHAFTFVKQI